MRWPSALLWLAAACLALAAEVRASLLPACPPTAVALAVLAFFALRPGKGWLRRKPPPALIGDDGDGKATPPSTVNMTNDSDDALYGLQGGAISAGKPPAPTSDAEGLDTLLPYSPVLHGDGSAVLDTLLFDAGPESHQCRTRCWAAVLH